MQRVLMNEANLVTIMWRAGKRMSGVESDAETQIICTKM